MFTAVEGFGGLRAAFFVGVGNVGRYRIALIARLELFFTSYLAIESALVEKVKIKEILNKGSFQCSEVNEIFMPQSVHKYWFC